MNMEQIKYQPGDEWLRSDAQILGRVEHTTHKKGIELTLAMPEGDDLSVVVEKLSASSATQFCNIARGEYDERQASKKAQKALSSFDGAEETVRAGSPKSISTHQAVVGQSIISREALQTRRDVLIREASSLSSELAQLADERELIDRILEVYDAPKDTTEKPSSVSSVPSREQGQVECVGEDSCSQEVYPAGETGSSSAS